MYYNHEDLSPSEDVTTDITNDLDEIEVISTQIIHLETPVPSCLQITSTSESRKKERRRKRINRIVAFCATCIFITCIALVCSTLMMSKNIDELVRNSNELLRKKDDPATPSGQRNVDVLNTNSSIS